jgi:hypothetical protein
MGWSWKIGRLAGINVYVHATLLFLILFILMMIESALLQAKLHRESGTTTALASYSCSLGRSWALRRAENVKSNLLGSRFRLTSSKNRG